MKVQAGQRQIVRPAEPDRLQRLGLVHAELAVLLSRLRVAVGVHGQSRPEAQPQVGCWALCLSLHARQPLQLHQAVHDDGACRGYLGSQVGRTFVHPMYQDLVAPRSGGLGNRQLADAGAIHPQSPLLHPLGQGYIEKRLPGVGDAPLSRIQLAQRLLVGQ